MVKKTENRYCSCGATLVVFSGVLPKELIDKWIEIHSGIGHEPTTSKKASYARKKELQRMEMKSILQ